MKKMFNSSRTVLWSALSARVDLAARLVNIKLIFSTNKNRRTMKQADGKACSANDNPLQQR